MGWLAHVHGDPLAWLLDPAEPGVRAAALMRLLGRAPDDPEVVAARAAAMATDPIRAILAAQHADGWWVKPGPGYAPKYTGTVWEVIFLDQLGADAADPRIRRACDYVLDRTRASTGGFGASGDATTAAPPSSVYHCLNGNLVRALIGFGHLDAPRLQVAIDWAAGATNGEGEVAYYRSGTSSPGFACGANQGQPCAWGAVKELLGLARVPEERRTPAVRRAIERGVAFLLSVDPLTADYPRPSYATRPSGSWFHLGFPSGYVTDLLQNLEALVALGHAGDPRLARSLAWLEEQQDFGGRWANRYAYNGKTVVDFEAQGAPSKWVTLRACAELRAVHG